MKTIFLIILSWGCCVFASAQQSVASFSTFILTHDEAEVTCLLNSPASIEFQTWLRDSSSRKAVIKYCDAYIDSAMITSITYYEYKEGWNSLEFDTVQLQSLSWYIDQDSLKGKPQLSKEQFQNYGEKLILNLIDPLITFLALDKFELNEERIRMDLSWVENLYTMQILFENYDYRIAEGKLLIPEMMQLRNRKLLAERLEIVEGNVYQLYQSYGSKSKTGESCELFMDNDVFGIGIGNQDREYTGGGAFSFTTDHLKWRWFNSGWIRKNSYTGKAKSYCNGDTTSRTLILNRGHVLSYQSVKLGMHFFTPYIRYRHSYDLADTLYRTDRPFGSYIYVERSKYRIWTKGLVRHQGNFQVGKIGTNAGRDIQAKLHQDAITSSQKVYGWNTQIANGGRWVYQINHKLDLMLFSTTNKFHSVFRPSSVRKKVKPYLGWNIYNSTELFYGGYYTAAGTGLFVSLLDFTKQTGQHLIAARSKKFKRGYKYEFGFNAETGIRYRYVHHNTMLEGFGYTKTIDDDIYDDEAESVYILRSDQIVRHLWIWELNLSFRWRKMVLYYRMVVQPKEYTVTVPEDYSSLNSLANPKDITFYDRVVIGELNRFNARNNYGYGTIGLVWVLN